MKKVRYPAEFKAEAVRHLIKRGHGVVDVAKRLGISDKASTYGFGLLKIEQSRAVERLPSSRRKWSAFSVNCDMSRWNATFKKKRS